MLSEVCVAKSPSRKPLEPTGASEDEEEAIPLSDAELSDVFTEPRGPFVTDVALPDFREPSGVCCDAKGVLGGGD